jgi:hypothetical protein
LIDNCIVCNTERCKEEDLAIADVYRCEGDSDPSDEAIVYAIESTSGIKGILINGYGISSDLKTCSIQNKIKRRE